MLSNQAAFLPIFDKEHKSAPKDAKQYHANFVRGTDLPKISQFKPSGVPAGRQ